MNAHRAGFGRAEETRLDAGRDLGNISEGTPIFASRKSYRAGAFRSYLSDLPYASAPGLYAPPGVGGFVGAGAGARDFFLAPLAPGSNSP